MNLNLPIIDDLKECNNILIAGAGGGYDIFCGLPLAYELKKINKNVHFVSMNIYASFAEVQKRTKNLIEDIVVSAHHDFEHLELFPEGDPAKYIYDKIGKDIPIWVIAKSGVRNVSLAYQTLCKKLNIDAIILVDGGVDSLMMGDEQGCGTILEDFVSLASIALIENCPVKILSCIGFGTEVEDNVCHHHVLSNISALMKMGGFLGSCSLTRDMESFWVYEKATQYTYNHQEKKSHISSRIIPAVRGFFGKFKDGDTEVFLSPLMGIYWFFDLFKVISQNQLLDTISKTKTWVDVMMVYREWLGTARLKQNEELKL